MMTRGLVAERVHVRRQVEVVVDRLGHMHHVDPAGGLLLDHHGRERGVVPADGDQIGHAQAQQRQHDVLQVLGLGRRVGARDADVRAATEVDAGDRINGQRAGVIDVALHEPLEAILDAEHVDALEQCADGGGGDDAVDAGRRPSAHEDREFLAVRHEALRMLGLRRGGEL